jgi:hypothetical protein
MELALFLSYQSFLRSKEQATLWIIIQIKKEEGGKNPKRKKKNKQTNKTNRPHRTSQLPSTLLLISHLSEALSLQSSTKRQNTQIVKLDSFLCVLAS